MSQVQVAEALYAFDGVSPAGGSTRTFTIRPTSLLKDLGDAGVATVFEDAWLIPDVCREPTGIWLGLNRREQQEALCYAGKPDYAFARAHGREIEEIRLPNGFVFLVFLTKDLEVTKWRLSKEDEDHPGFPLQHATRFGERLWPKD
jgi:hypothetical protein